MIRLLTWVQTYWLALTCLCLAGITLASLWPLDALPPVPGSDKLHHLLAYACLMIPTALRKPDKWVLYGLLYIAFSGAIELIQPYVNRYAEWSDMLANTLGVVCGLVLVEIVKLVTPTTFKQIESD